jgi:hypothetical protein
MALLPSFILSKVSADRLASLLEHFSPCFSSQEMVYLYSTRKAHDESQPINYRFYVIEGPLGWNLGCRRSIPTGYKLDTSHQKSQQPVVIAIGVMQKLWRLDKGLMMHSRPGFVQYKHKCDWFLPLWIHSALWKKRSEHQHNGFAVVSYIRGFVMVFCHFRTDLPLPNVIRSTSQSLCACLGY